MDFKIYQEKKTAMKQSLDEALAVAKALETKQTVKNLTTDMRQLDDERFQLVVVGEFSRGKSTFVNAMLGRAMLPSSKQPTTNVISKIVYGDKPSYTLHYRSGEEKPIDEESFLGIKAQAEERESLLSRAKNIGKSLTSKKVSFEDIEYARIAYPLSFCRNQVDVVDTPGTNDLNVGRMEITLNYIQKADAAILVLSATQALTQSELDFLKEQLLGNHIEDIFIVINYKDALDSVEQEARVVEHVSAAIYQHTRRMPRIFLVSSYQTLLYRREKNGEKLSMKQMLKLPESIEKTGFPTFEESLGRYLSEEKGLSKLRKYASRIQAYTEDALQSIERELMIVERSADEIKAEFQVMQPKFRKTKRDAERILSELRVRLQAGETELVNQASIAFGQMRQAAVASIDEYEENMSGEDVKYLVNKAITPIQKKMLDSLNGIQNSLISAESQRTLEKLRGLWDDITIHTNSLAVIERGQVGMNFYIEKQETSIAKTLGAIAGIAAADFTGVGLLIGLGLAFFGAFAGEQVMKKDPRIALRGQVRSQMTSQEDAFVGKVSQQYLAGIDRFVSVLQDDVMGRIDEMEAQLQRIIREKESTEFSAQEQKNQLRDAQTKLRRIAQQALEVVDR